MASLNNSDFIQGSLFEEDYLVRTLGNLAHSAEIALTELVANAWDAGATTVDIFIPEEFGQKLIIEDNGIGLTKDQFHYRWMRLGYNRLKHQGKEVKFPPNVEGKRIAYGRNGVGRHGLLCFNNEYKVVTNSFGEKSTFTITTLSETQPFVIKSETFQKSNKSGTRLEVVVAKNLPNPERILNIISAKFLHDPKFILSINRRTVPLEDHSGLINSKELVIGPVKLQAHFIDTQKSAKSTLYQGIAFWQSRRLVGEPSWVLGNEIVLDGRTKFAKRYTVVVESDDLAEFINEDWTGFIKGGSINEIYKEVSKYVSEMVSTIAIDSIAETTRKIKNEFAGEFNTLSPLAKYEVNEAIESIAIQHPMASPESISLAVEAIINLEKTRTGKELLFKLSKLSDNDVSGLNELLEKWSVRDALSVLDEIDNRLSVIEAIRKLSNDKDVDELHTLHPLVTAARWIFGPEFDSVEYSSNRQLHSAIEATFKTKINKDVFNNFKKRPDIVVLGQSTLSVTGTEAFENNLSTINKVLIIELKKGGFKLSREERNQAVGYVEDFMNCGRLIYTPYIEAFVVGDSFSEKVQPISTVKNESNVEMGKVTICTFSQLVDTAEKRLFGLRDKLNERYDDIPGMELFRQHSEQQLKVEFADAS
ncbi:ATP-binding protein [Adhaeribacter soli]|uniref:ATP-binding protein n=1 Tax=Adhaeribacter soli TaxID=2607655 RepID=A0A5N1IZU9_9BACT|nr:ATP-binding protein [Adhaeribacter soli]KAA9333622.1 ATP-binding protein [Adhaeribacter soli]